MLRGGILELEGELGGGGGGGGAEAGGGVAGDDVVDAGGGEQGDELAAAHAGRLEARGHGVDGAVEVGVAEASFRGRTGRQAGGAGGRGGAAAQPGGASVPRPWASPRSGVAAASCRQAAVPAPLSMLVVTTTLTPAAVAAAMTSREGGRPPRRWGLRARARAGA